jgi:hypothetical protein
MPFNVPYKTKQFFFLLLKLSLVVGAFYFIYWKLTQNDKLQFDVFLSFLKENEVFSLKNSLFLIVLSSLNWFFEILKWKYLVRIIKPISFKDALEQSLGSLTASLITPNRIGEYGAKAIYYEKPLRPKVVLLNLLGNLSQMAITTSFGLVGLVLFINRYPIAINYNTLLIVLLSFVFLVIITVLAINQKHFTIKGVSIHRILEFVKRIPLKAHGINLALALLRYGVFSFQLYYLLSIFGVDLSYLSAMTVITSMYFLASIIPSISIFDVVIKGSVAVFLFDFIQVDELTVLNCITLMWLLNFVLPSVFGSYYVLNFKLPKAQA